jgi:hypothetical protein
MMTISSSLCRKIHSVSGQTVQILSNAPHLGQKESSSGKPDKSHAACQVLCLTWSQKNLKKKEVSS